MNVNTVSPLTAIIRYIVYSRVLSLSCIHSRTLAHPKGATENARPSKMQVMKMRYMKMRDMIKRERQMRDMKIMRVKL